MANTENLSLVIINNSKEGLIIISVTNFRREIYAQTDKTTQEISKSGNEIRFVKGEYFDMKEMKLFLY